MQKYMPNIFLSTKNIFKSTTFVKRTNRFKKYLLKERQLEQKKILDNFENFFKRLIFTPKRNNLGKSALVKKL